MSMIAFVLFLFYLFLSVAYFFRSKICQDPTTCIFDNVSYTDAKISVIQAYLAILSLLMFILNEIFNFKLILENIIK